MTALHQRYRVVAAVAIATALSGCGQAEPTAPVESVPLASPSPSETPMDREHAQAQAALAFWAAAVEANGDRQDLVTVGELTGQIGSWEREVGSNNKAALAAGILVPAVHLPSGSPGKGGVRWEDGRTKTVDTMSAEEALALWVRADEYCPDCDPLEVISARLSSATFQTSRGPASAPAWEFRLRGTRVVVTGIAVAANDRITVTVHDRITSFGLAFPPWDPNDTPIGIPIESATGTVDGTQLTVAFPGAPATGDKPCGADYTAEAVESPNAVVVIVHGHAHAIGEVCLLVGAQRTAAVDLDAPLGDRTVLDVVWGLPVPVLLAP